MNGRKVTITTIAGGVLLLLAAGGGYAKPILQEDFRGAVPGMKGGQIVDQGGGRAWRGPGGHVRASEGGVVTYEFPASGLNPLQGTIELDLTRGEAIPCEALFSLAGADGYSLLALRVDWEGGTRRGGERPVLNTLTPTPSPLFSTPGKDDFGHPLDKSGMFLEKSVANGQTTHFALTWGPQGPRVFQDGKELSGRVNHPELFTTLAPLVKKLVIGGYTMAHLPDSTFCTSRSAIANVQIHDLQLDAGQLGGLIESAVSVASVTDNAFKAGGFSGKLVAGNKLQVTVEGTPGATAAFDIVHFTDLDRKITLDWKGYGTYLDDKTFFEKDEVNLRDVTAYRVYVGREPIDLAALPAEPAALLKVQEQTYTLESLEPDTPYYTMVVAEMRDGTLKTVMATPTNLPMTETTPGVYGAEYGVGYQDRYPKAVVVGRLARGSATAALAETKPFTMDPSLTIEVVAEPNELKADEKSVSKVTATVTDANGDPVAGHTVKFLLATTSQYTGVVGGGEFAKSVGGEVKKSAWEQTDLFGKITATYVAGFAAKTAIIVARDMESSSTGAGYVKTYIQAAAELELMPLVSPAADAGYSITVTSSDEWLTADGKSQARITANVTLNSKPVEGHQVSFVVSSGAGSIRAVSQTTDRNGAARAVYTAGKKIGVVLITATDTTVGISGSVQIELRSDAPAKIAIKLDPEKLPADGRSRADISVLVTDINDNPNENTEVEYRLISGGGTIRDEKGLTDRNGESTSEYVAGKSPGKVSIEITVRSMVPTEQELDQARELALAVTDYDFF